MHQIQNRPREAEEAYRKAVAADPEFVKPHRQLAFLAFHLQEWPKVLEATDRLLWLDPVSYPDGYYFDSVALTRGPRQPGWPTQGLRRRCTAHFPGGEAQGAVVSRG